MLPSTLELLRDILREAEFLESEAQRTNQVAFLGNEVLKRAFVRSVEVIGEAAKQVPKIRAHSSRTSSGRKWPACAIASFMTTLASTT